MKVCLFNPWHDMALAYGKKPFTPPSVAVRMSQQLCDLAGLWMDEEGELLLWGWDCYTKKMLLKEGYDKSLMPTDEELETLRILSNRKTFVPLLRNLREISNTVGESMYVDNYDALAELMSKQRNKVVLKAPWSGSGRGVRMVDTTAWKSKSSDSLWAKRIIDVQGGIMLEPFYNKKVRDFAMEFSYDFHLDKPEIKYLGLSLFRNSNGGNAYEGNIVASEEQKVQLLENYINRQQIEEIKEKIIPMLIRTLSSLRISTPFGVDMMIVKTAKGYKIHPCVEVNLRRTMGYLAIKLYEQSVVNNNSKRQINYETDFIGYFNVDVHRGKWTICESGMESRQW